MSTLIGARGPQPVIPKKDGDKIVALEIRKDGKTFTLRIDDRVKMIDDRVAIIIGFVETAAAVPGSHMRSQSKFTYSVQVDASKNPVNPTSLTLI